MKLDKLTYEKETMNWSKQFGRVELLVTQQLSRVRWPFESNSPMQKIIINIDVYLAIG